MSTRPPILQDQASVTQAQETVTQDQKTLSETTLTAPFAGTVTALNGAVGQTVSGGGNSAVSSGRRRLEHGLGHSAPVGRRRSVGQLGLDRVSGSSAFGLVRVVELVVRLPHPVQHVQPGGGGRLRRGRRHQDRRRPDRHASP